MSDSPPILPAELSNLLKTSAIEKNPGPDWAVYYIEPDGTKGCMSLYGCPDIYEALRDAESSFAGQVIEFVAVVRADLDLDTFHAGTNEAE